MKSVVRDIGLVFVDNSRSPLDPTLHLKAWLRSDACRSSVWIISLSILGLTLTACGLPQIGTVSEPLQSGLTEEGDTLEYLATVELAPGALSEVRRGYFTVNVDHIGSGDGVPQLEVSGGDPMTVGGQIDELGRHSFVWDWELPEDCDQGCEVTLPVGFEMVEARGGASILQFTVAYSVEMPDRIRREQGGDLDGVVTVEQVS